MFLLNDFDYQSHVSFGGVIFLCMLDLYSLFTSLKCGEDRPCACGRANFSAAKLVCNHRQGKDVVGHVTISYFSI